MRYLLLFLSLAPAWGGSINLISLPTFSCVVTTLPTNAVVANDCNSTPGISASGNGNLGIKVQWGEDLFSIFSAASFGVMIGNFAADSNLVATETLFGHLEYDQNFIITGGSGSGFISPNLLSESDGHNTSCSVIISTGETNTTDPNGLLSFTFGIPFHLQISVDIYKQLSASHGTSPALPDNGGGCDKIGTPTLLDLQGHSLNSFDLEPTDLPLQETPEPRTWLLVSAGLFGCWLMKR